MRETAVIEIFDEIGPEWAGMIGVKTISKALKDIDAKDYRGIELRINSPGGSVFEGIAIYNALKAHKLPVTVKVMGIAASIASVIAMAGKRRVMMQGALMMVHKAWGITVGNADDHIDSADMLSTIDEQIAGIYAAKTNEKDPQKWAEIMMKDTWYSADDAIEAGLADEGEESPAQVVNARRSMDEYGYTHAPEQAGKLWQVAASVSRGPLMIYGDGTGCALPWLRIDGTNANDTTTIFYDHGAHPLPVEIHTQEAESMDIKSMTMDQLAAERPELVKAIQDEAKAEAAKASNEASATLLVTERARAAAIAAKADELQVGAKLAAEAIEAGLAIEAAINKLLTAKLAELQSASANLNANAETNIEAKPEANTPQARSNKVASRALEIQATNKCSYIDALVQADREVK